MQKLERYGLTFVRVYLGAFNFFAGLNFFVRFLPQPVPADPVGSAFMHATLSLGLFQLAKALELVCGFCLIFELWVPIALCALLPVTATIFAMDTFFAHLMHVRVSGARNFAFHIILLAAYGQYYYSLLKMRAKSAPIWSNWREVTKQL